MIASMLVIVSPMPMTNYSYFPKCGGQVHLRAASQPIAGARMARRKIKRSPRSVRGNHDIYRSVNGIGLKEYRQVGSRGKGEGVEQQSRYLARSPKGRHRVFRGSRGAHPACAVKCRKASAARRRFTFKGPL